MTETFYTLTYKTTFGGGDTGEPEETTETTIKDLTKEERDSWEYTLENGDFGGACFWDIRIKEQ
jgi:hypothetical protein